MRPEDPRQGMRKAVFLDRDGTLIVDRGYISDPEQVELLEGVHQALLRLQKAGFLLFIVTNQSGIGRGYYTEADMHRTNAQLMNLLPGVKFTKIYFAPEPPNQASYGRKPSPAFLIEAAREFDIDLSRSYMIGDKLSDLQCGIRAGVARSILVRTGEGRQVEAQQPLELKRAVVVNNLSEAVDWILQEEERNLQQ